MTEYCIFVLCLTKSYHFKSKSCKPSNLLCKCDMTGASHSLQPMQKDNLKLSGYCCVFVLYVTKVHHFKSEQAGQAKQSVLQMRYDRCLSFPTASAEGQSQNVCLLKLSPTLDENCWGSSDKEAKALPGWLAFRSGRIVFLKSILVSLFKSFRSKITYKY